MCKPASPLVAQARRELAVRNEQPPNHLRTLLCLTLRTPPLGPPAIPTSPQLSLYRRDATRPKSLDRTPSAAGTATLARDTASGGSMPRCVACRRAASNGPATGEAAGAEGASAAMAPADPCHRRRLVRGRRHRQRLCGIRIVVIIVVDLLRDGQTTLDEFLALILVLVPRAILVSVRAPGLGRRAGQRAVGQINLDVLHVGLDGDILVVVIGVLLEERQVRNNTPAGKPRRQWREVQKG